MKNILAVGVVLFAACQTATDAGPTSGPTSDGNEGVTMRIATPDHLAGTYVDASGLGIKFDTARTGDGLYLDISTMSGHELIHAETTATTYVFRYLDSRLTLAVDKTWVARVQAEGDDGPAAKEADAMHWTGDMAVLDEMIQLPEVRELPWLSRSLGALGYTGNNFPAALAMHSMARESANALGIELPPLAVEPSAEGDFCGQPTANDCYGMCGYGCSCWSWVCGDCCYHGGCAKHDSWCRNGQWYYCYNITAVIALFGC